ncbi:Sec-independent protein translocase protein TatB [Paracoccus sp. (in: a-proteobacteria)]|uniref:Sec-independent protein translocase protein TatB n=1 Tax=Paracoccus sp. TaxID=267 RepID=UPI00321F7E04
MLDIGWSELLLIGVVALIVIGPEDLPKLFHTLGRITARARSMAREFSSAMEDAAKASGLDDAARTLKDVNALTSKRALGLDALERATERFEKWDPLNPREEAAQKAPVADPAAPAPPVETAPGIAAPHPAPEDEGADTAGGRRRLHAVRRLDRAGQD